MKTTIKAALGCILAIAFSATANAASIQIAQDAAQLMQQSTLAQRFMSEQLGLKAGASQAELTKAIGQLSTEQQLGVIAHINAFSDSARAVGTNAGAKTKVAYEQIAKTAFTTTNGQLIQVAAMITNASNREEITNGNSPASTLTAGNIAVGTEEAPSCAPMSDEDFADALAKKLDGTGVTKDEIVADMKSGDLTKGKCGSVEGPNGKLTAQGPLSFKEVSPAVNAVRMATDARTDCGRGIEGAERDACLIRAAQKELDLDQADATALLPKLDGDCALWGKRLNVNM